MSFPRYPKYKDSGVEWLGDVPEHWGVMRFQRCVDVAEGQVDPEDAVFSQMSLIAPNYIESGTGRLFGLESAKDQGAESGKYLCKAGDVVYSKIRPALRKVCIAPEDCLCSADMYPLRSHSGLMNPFLFWLILSEEFSALAVLESERVAMPKINRESLKAVALAIPSLNEQAKIASFLDLETSKIDALVGEQRRLIELLKEKRQAVISRAVTKGLNPNAPLKPSGIEWLGDVPEHWETRTIAKASSKITNGFVGPTRDILVESGTPYIQATHIKKGRVIFDEGYFVTQEWSKSHAKSILAEGDVLIVQTGAGTGDVGLVSCNEVGYNCHALIIVTCLEDLLLGAFLAAVLQSDFGHQRLESIQTGGMHPHLNCGNVKYVEVPVPPNNEQAEIVAHINEMSATFDALTAEAERAIVLLQERRTALISAAVTGKIDVREFALQGAKQ